MIVELRVLKYFLAVAEEGNISRAAELLYLTQSTLSRQLINLEKELGVKLFQRGKSAITLTPEGMQLKRRARDIISLANKAERELSGGDGDTLEHGYNGAEVAVMLDPDIQVFLCCQMSAGLGVNNYLEANNADFSKIGIFGTSEDDTTAEMLEKAGRNESGFRGTMSAGAGVPDKAVNTMVEALLEGTVPLGTLRVDPMKAWTSSDYTCDYTIDY